MSNIKEELQPRQIQPEAHPNPVERLKSLPVPTPERIRSAENPRLVQAGALSRIRWLIHGFSTRSGGVSEAYGGQALNLGYTKHDTHAAVDENRALLLRALGGVDAEGDRGRWFACARSIPTSSTAWTVRLTKSSPAMAW